MDFFSNLEDVIKEFNKANERWEIKTPLDGFAEGIILMQNKILESEKGEKDGSN